MIVPGQREDLVGAHRDEVPAGRGDGAHRRDDRRAGLAQPQDLAVDRVGGDVGAAGAHDPQHDGRDRRRPRPASRSAAQMESEPASGRRAGPPPLRPSMIPPSTVDDRDDAGVFAARARSCASLLRRGSWQRSRLGGDHLCT